MTESFSALIDILGRQKQGYEQLLGQSREKKEAIVHSNVNVLEGIVGREQDLLRLLEDIENERLETAKRIARECECSPEDITIGFCIERAEEPYKSQLADIKDSLGAIVREQTAINDLNMQLLKNQLEYVEFMLTAMTTPSTLNSTYTSGGVAPEMEDRLKLFDQQI